MNPATKLDIYEKVTNRVIESLEQGVVPWKKPWTVLPPQNLNSKRRYSGLNVFLLSLSPYKSPYWCTFKGAKAAGGSVKKGEKGTTVIFWRILEVDDPQAKGGKKKIPLLRGYTVFNAEQCEDIKIPAGAGEDFAPVDDADWLIENMPNAPKINHGGDNAYYDPRNDEVTVPDRIRFHSVEGYYGTVFHELIHATGHEDRLNRVKDWAGFGTDPYAKEELVAEMGASLLSAFSGVTTDDSDYSQNAAYIRSWISKLRGDKKLLVSAASQAQKAADYIYGQADEHKAGGEE